MKGLNKKIKIGAGLKNPKTRMRFTLNEVKRLRKLYPNTDNNNIAKLMNTTYSRVVNKAFALGLKKSKKYISSLPTEQMRKKGAEFMFKKGQTSWNKGKSWDEIMTKEGRRNSMKTTFKKGNLPHNTRKNKDISIRRDKGGRPYKFIRVELGKWIPLHVYNWQKKYGKIPKGKIVVFKTRQFEDCSVKQLELITREENMKRNTIHRYPKEIKSTIKLLSKLKKTIYGKEQNSRPA